MPAVKNNGEAKGISLYRFSIFTMLAAVAVIAFAMVVTSYISQHYNRLNMDTQTYSELESKADDVKAASDYLSEQVRLFVWTMDPVHAELYFEEVNETRRRENAVEFLDRLHFVETWSTQLNEAVAESNRLMERELYAMKLIAVARGYGEGDIPPEVAAVELSERDAIMAPTAMIEKARSMMFDEEYQHAKAVIYEHLNSYTMGVLHRVSQGLQEGRENLAGWVMAQRVAMVVMAAISVTTFVMIWANLLAPMRSQIAAVEEKTPPPPRGVRELRRLINAYHKRLNQANAEKKEYRDQAERLKKAQGISGRSGEEGAGE